MPVQQSTLICLYTVLFCSPIDVYMGTMAINMYFYLIMGNLLPWEYRDARIYTLTCFLLLYINPNTSSQLLLSST